MHLSMARFSSAIACATDSARSYWAQVWTGSVTPWPFAVFRIGVASVVLLRTTDLVAPWISMEHHGFVVGLDHDSSREHLVGPRLWSPLWAWLPSGFVGVEHILAVLRTALALLLLVGFRPRAAAISLGIVGYVLMAFDRYRYLHHLHFLWITCALIALTPCAERLSVDRWLGWTRREKLAPRWPLQVLRFQLVIAYVAAAVGKLNSAWLDGTVLVALEREGLVRGWLWTLLRDASGYAGAAVMVCALELLVPVLLISKRSRLIGIAAGIGLHAAISSMMVVFTFGVQMALYLMLFLPWVPEGLRANDTVAKHAGSL